MTARNPNKWGGMSSKSSGHHIHTDSAVQKEVLVRLSRIEGQIRGVSKMVSKEDYCENILIQFASIRSALNSAMMLIFDEHVRTCIAGKMVKDKKKASDELLNIIKKIIK